MTSVTEGSMSENANASVLYLKIQTKWGILVYQAGPRFCLMTFTYPLVKKGLAGRID